MKIALAQIACAPGDVSANCALMVEQAARARAAGCSLVVFPEMSDTGYAVEVIRQAALPVTGEAFQAMKRVAARERIFIAAGLSERKAGKIYNTLSVFDPRGALIGKYRKAHLFNPPPVKEGDCVTAGNRLVLMDIGGFKCGLMICYDLRFPEMARSLALKGAEVILIASAWPFPRSEHWQVLLRARAIENQCYVLAANRTGTDAGSNFCGSSSVIDPYGMALGVAAPDRSQLVIADIDRATLDWARAKMPVFGDRRPDIYRLKTSQH